MSLGRHYGVPMALLCRSTVELTGHLDPSTHISGNRVRGQSRPRAFLLEFDDRVEEIDLLRGQSHRDYFDNKWFRL
jgi:hypothetical protein